MTETTWMWRLRTAMDNARFSQGSVLSTATVVVDAMSLAACLAYIEEQESLLQEANEALQDAQRELEKMAGVPACRSN